jgi:hypothetical protein
VETRQIRRAKERKLAKTLALRPQSETPRERAHTVDLVLWFLAAFLALALFLAAPKLGQKFTFVALLAMAGCLVHPISQIPFVRNEKSAVKHTSLFIGLWLLPCVLIVAFGVFVWPPNPYYKELTLAGREQFMDVLRIQKEPKETLIVKCPSNDEELCTVATTYLQMFQRAGWKTPTGGIERGLYLKSFPGVTISKRPQPGEPDRNNPDVGLWVQQTPSVITIKNAFHQIGVEVRRDADQDLPENTISIYFGPAPHL